MVVLGFVGIGHYPYFLKVCKYSRSVSKVSACLFDSISSCFIFGFESF